MHITQTVDGTEPVELSGAEYDDLIDFAHHEAMMRDMALGLIETLSDEDAAKHLAAPTSLAFWREHRGLTQQQLADATGLLQSSNGYIKAAHDEATLSVYADLGRRPGALVDDLTPDLD